MRFLPLLLTLLLIAQPALAQSPFIYGGGGRAKSLSTNGITLKNGATLDSDGPENLVKNARAEDPTIPTSFKVYDDGASATPTDGTGGSPSVITTWARSTSSPIQGNASFTLAKGTGDAQGKGWAYEFTVPANHAMAKSYFAALNFSYLFSDTDGPAVRVYVYDVTNATLITPSFTTCGGGSTPVLTATTTTCAAQLGFVTTTGTSYRVLWHVADTDTDDFTLKVDNLQVTTEGGPQVGANVGPWISYTPTFGAGFGTVSTHSIKYRQNGQNLELMGEFTVGTAAGTAPTISLPGGLTIDTSLVTASKTKLGEFNHLTASSYVTNSAASAVGQKLGVLFYSATGGTSALYFATQTNGLSPATFRDDAGTDVTATGEVISIRASVPISQWAGGTAFGENNCEYAYNSSGITAAGASDTTAFAYGPSGVSTGAIASTTANSTTTMRVRFKPPIQETDSVLLQFKSGTGSTTWSVPANFGFGKTAQGTSLYGADLFLVSGSTTDLDVRFGNKGAIPYNSTYGTDGVAWTSTAASWRVVKCKGGTPVPFGLATSTTPGLVSYEDSGTFTVSLTGAFQSTQTPTIRYSRSGKNVVLSFPAVNASCNAASSITGAAGQIPAGLRPAGIAAATLLPVYDNSTYPSSPGLLSIGTDGSIAVYKKWDASTFSNTGSCGWVAGQTIAYPTN